MGTHLSIELRELAYNRTVGLLCVGAQLLNRLDVRDGIDTAGNIVRGSLMQVSCFSVWCFGSSTSCGRILIYRRELSAVSKGAAVQDGLLSSDVEL